MSALILSACAESDGPTRYTRGRVPVYEYGNENEALRQTKNWKLNCADKTNCPNTVGQLVVAIGKSVGVCTATLVANDLVVTNSHCFDLQNNAPSPESICNRGSVIVFASQSVSGREVVECGSVVAKSRILSEIAQMNFRNPDYMILRLKRPLNRGFERVDSSGLSDGLKLQIRKVDPVNRGGGKLVVEDCETLHGTFLMAAANHRYSPVHVQSRCQVIPGNSGASLFDRNGNIRAVIFATLDQERLYMMAGNMPEASFRNVQRAQPSIATNGACIKWSSGAQLPPECAKGLTDKEHNAALNAGLDEGKVVSSMVQESRNQISDPRFVYELSELQQDGPRSPQFSSKYKPVCYTAEFVKSLQGSPSQILIQILNWRGELGLTPRLKLEPQVKSSREFCEYTIVGAPSSAGIQVKTLQRECQVSGLFENWKPCR